MADPQPSPSPAAGTGRSRGMGRGLAAILTATAPAGQDPGPVSADLRQIPVDLVTPNPHQPRRAFDDESLQALAGSLAERGVLQPILVRPVAGGTYELIAGERRWRASELAGEAEVPVVVVSTDDEGAWEMALVENIQRQALSPLDEGEAIHHLMQLQGLSIREAAKKLGKDRGYLENRLALRRAGADVREMVSLRNDTLMQAKLIDKVAEPELRGELIRVTLEENAPITLVQKRIEDANGRRVEGGSAPTSSSSAPKTPAASLRNDTQGHGEQAKGSLLERALRPASALLGGALQEMREAPISASQRHALQEEITLLKHHLQELEAVLADK